MDIRQHFDNPHVSGHMEIANSGDRRKRKQ